MGSIFPCDRAGPRNADLLPRRHEQRRFDYAAGKTEPQRPAKPAATQLYVVGCCAWLCGIRLRIRKHSAFSQSTRKIHRCPRRCNGGDSYLFCQRSISRFIGKGKKNLSSVTPMHIMFNHISAVFFQLPVLRYPTSDL